MSLRRRNGSSRNKFYRYGMASKPRKPSKHTPKQAWSNAKFAPGPAGDRPVPSPGWEAGKGARKNPRPEASPRAGQPPKRGTFAAREQGEAKSWDRGASWMASGARKK